jgi:hypothetical protein
LRDALGPAARPDKQANGDDTDGDLTTPVHVAGDAAPGIVGAVPNAPPADARHAVDTPGVATAAPSPAAADIALPRLPPQLADAFPPIADLAAILAPGDAASPVPTAMAEAPLPASPAPFGGPVDSEAPSLPGQAARVLPPTVNPQAILARGDATPHPTPAAQAETVDPAAIPTPGDDPLLAFPAPEPSAVPEETTLLAWQGDSVADVIGLNVSTTGPELPIQVALAPLLPQDAIL